MGGFQSDFRPTQLRRCLISHFRALCDFGALIFRIATSDVSHFGHIGHSEGVPTVGGFRSYFRPSQLRAVSKFPFPISANSGGGANFQSHRFRRVKFWSKTAILRDRRRWVDFSPISAAEITRRFYFSLFAYCAILGTNCQNRHFRRVCIFQKRTFRAIANGGRIAVLFSPVAITRGF